MCPSSVPSSRPLVVVECAAGYTHELRLEGEGSPTRRGKPPGTIGAEVWLALTPAGGAAPPLNSPRAQSGGPSAGGPGASPQPTDAYKFLSVSSRGNLQTDFPSADAGKTAYYALRWVSTHGEKGPWSDVAAATVAA